MDWLKRIPRDAHWLIVGGTRRGKSFLLSLITRIFILSGLEGVTAIDAHGAYVRDVIEWLANPHHRQHDRDIVILDPSTSATFGLNCLEVPDTSWESCHAVANLLTAVLESRFEASPEQTPRLSRIVYVAAMFCARRRLSLLELVEVLSLGGEELRVSLLSEFDNDIVRRELEDLHTLACKSPARFLELVESAKNRFIRWLGDPRLARILGQRTGLNPRKLMDKRSIVLADFSSLDYQDAAFLGSILSTMYFAAARFRPPLRAARHRLILDEAELLLSCTTARMCDQSAKWGLNLIASIQRLGQLRARGDFLFDALMSNCGVQVLFGGLPPESARYMAEQFFAGNIDLAEWKPGSERLVAVGSHREVVRNRSTAHHTAEHEATSETDSIAIGRSQTHMLSVTDAEGESITDATSQANALGSMTSEASGASLSSFDGASLSQSVDPNSMNGIFMPPTILGANIGASTGTGAASSSSRGSGSSSTQLQGSSHATSTSRMHAVTEGFATTESEVRGFAHSRMRGTSRGLSESSGEGETFVTSYALLPSTMYSLEEQLHRLAGEIAMLPRRHCIVKIENERPIGRVPPTWRRRSARRSSSASPCRSFFRRCAPQARICCQYARPIGSLQNVGTCELHRSPSLTSAHPSRCSSLTMPSASLRISSSAIRRPSTRPSTSSRAARVGITGESVMSESDTLKGMPPMLLRPLRLTKPDPAELPFRLQPRDEAIVRFVANNRFADSDQIFRYLCIGDQTTSEQNVSRRLRALFAHRFLTRPPNQHLQIGALAHLIYSVGIEGVRLLAASDQVIDQRTIWAAKKSRRAAAPNLNHALAVTETMLHFYRAIAARDGVRLMDQPELIATTMPAETQAKAHPLRLRVTIKDGFKPMPLSVVADRAFALHYANNTRHNLMLEVDQGTMTIAARRLTASSVGKKIRVYYTAYLENRHHALGMQGFRVATVTPSEARLQAMIEAQRTITNNKMSGMFLYSTPARIAEHGALAPVWTTSKAERVSLIQE